LLVAVLCAALVVFLRRPRAAGSAGALFALYYSTDRLFLDFLRTDKTRAFGLTGTQLASIVVIAVVAAWLLARNQRPTTPADGATVTQTTVEAVP
ncbi:MAG: prolipoprotein diacylglyceryl transferase family protein, partial [Acidimicrobiales bacterium]